MLGERHTQTKVNMHMNGDSTGTSPVVQSVTPNIFQVSYIII